MMNHLERFCRTLEKQRINNQYDLKKLIGSGGYSCVFEANEILWWLIVKRKVAIQLIPSSPADTDKHFNNLNRVINLKSPNVIVSHTYGEYQINNKKFFYLVMEKADYSLEDRLEKGKMSDQETKQLIRDVASGFKALHKKNLVHQDLKPRNVLWVKDCWKISDFATVRDLGPNSYAHTSNPVGTTAYMPPEAFGLQPRIGTEWDIWSLGIMIVNVLTGELPYNLDRPDQLEQQVKNGNINLPPMPDELERIVNGCLEKNPTKRWTAADVLAALPDTSVITPKEDKYKFLRIGVCVVLAIGLGGLVLRSCTTDSLPSCPPDCDPTTSTSTATPTPTPPTPPTPPSVVQQSISLDEQSYFYPAQPGTDKKGNTAYVSVYVLLRDFAWEIGSSDTIINTITNDRGNLQEIENKLKSDRIQEDFANKLIGVISLGTASCEITADISPENALKIEEKRATERGEGINRMVTNSIPPRNNITYQNILVLGQFRNCLEPIDSSLTESQRRVIIIGITEVKEINENINLEEALRDRFTKTPIAEISIENYSTFQLKL